MSKVHLAIVIAAAMILFGAGTAKATVVLIDTVVYTYPEILDVVSIHQTTALNISLTHYFRYFSIDGTLRKAPGFALNRCEDELRITSDPSYRSCTAYPVKFFDTCDEAFGTYWGESTVVIVGAYVADQTSGLEQLVCTSCT